MDGKKFVIALFGLVLLMAAITFTLYLLTRQVDNEEGNGDLIPNAVVRYSPAAEQHLA